MSYTVFLGFRSRQQDDYYRANFDHFLKQAPFFGAAGALAKN
jgi:hypothetical protein